MMLVLVLILGLASQSELGHLMMVEDFLRWEVHPAFQLAMELGNINTFGRNVLV